MLPEVDEQSYVWQPLMVICPERIECRCGSKAIFVVLEHVNNDAWGDYNWTGWCRDCWEKAQG